MIIKPLKYNDYAQLDLGSISGSREDLTILRDAIDKVLTGSVGDTRRHTQPAVVSNGGIMVHKDQEWSENEESGEESNGDEE